MKLWPLFPLLLSFSCARVIRLHSETSKYKIRKFDVASKEEAETLINSRLNYLRKLLRSPEKSHSPIHYLCEKMVTVRNPETDADGNLVSVSDVFFTPEGHANCPTPRTIPGFIVFSWCNQKNYVTEIRVLERRNFRKVEFECR